MKNGTGTGCTGCRLVGNTETHTAHRVQSTAVLRSICSAFGEANAFVSCFIDVPIVRQNVSQQSELLFSWLTALGRKRMSSVITQGYPISSPSASYHSTVKKLSNTKSAAGLASTSHYRLLLIGKLITSSRTAECLPAAFLWSHALR